MILLLENGVVPVWSGSFRFEFIVTHKLSQPNAPSSKQPSSYKCAIPHSGDSSKVLDLYSDLYPDVPEPDALPRPEAKSIKVKGGRSQIARTPGVWGMLHDFQAKGAIAFSVIRAA